MAKKSLLFCAAMLAAGSAGVNAEVLTPAQALQRAMASSPAAVAGANGASKFVANPAMTGKYQDAATLYVFDRADQNGFIIVPADDAVPAEVLGYVEQGTFDAAKASPELLWLLDNYRLEISAASRAGLAAGPRRSEAADRADIAPMVGVRWSQEEPYNLLCPEIGGVRTVTGCVATAMAQIAKYHEWPAVGQGSISYNSYDPEGSGKRTTVSVNFAESVYDWENMIPSYLGSSTEEQRMAVAKICFDCGAAAKMGYGTQASGAVSTEVGPGLYKYLNYDKGMVYVERNLYFLNDWLDLLYDELAAGRPIYYSGRTVGGDGHAFILDGFRSEGNYFHLNWGWNGMSNGYFRISALDPDSQGIGGSTEGFNLDQSAWLGIQPPVEGSTIKPAFYAADAFTAKSKQISRSSSSASATFYGASSYASIVNYSLEPLRYTLGVQIKNKETGEVKYLESTTGEKEYSMLRGETRFAVKQNEFPETGSFEVRPAYKFGGEWQLLPQPVDVRQRYLNLEATSARLVFSDPEPALRLVAENFEADSALYTNAIYQAVVDLKAEEAPAYCRLQLNIANKAQTRVYATLAEQIVDLNEGEQATIALNGYVEGGKLTSVLDSTECLLVLNRIIGSSSVQVATKPVIVRKNDCVARTTKVTFTGRGSGSKLSPARFPIDNFEATALITCYQGHFSEVVFGAFIDNAGYIIGTLSAGVVSIGEGETAEVTFKGDASGFLEVGKKYRFTPYSTHDSNIYFERYIQPEEPSAIEIVGASEAAELTLGLEADELTVATLDAIRLVELYDVQGRKAAAVEGNGLMSQTCAVGQLAKGVYIVKVVTDNGAYTDRIVKK